MISVRIQTTTFQLICVLIALLSASIETDRCFASTLRNSIDISVPLAPIPVRVENTEELVYELHLTNLSLNEITLHTLSVLDSSDSQRLSRWSELDLAKRFRLTGDPGGSEGSNLTMHPGQTAIVYIELLRPLHHIPTTLMHTIDYSISDQRTVYTINGGEIVMPERVPVELGPPLGGGPWVAVYSPDWDRGHRRVFYTVNGRAHLPGRFAIDFFKVDDEGKTTHGDRNQVQNALGYGAPVLAVADALVVAVRDGVRETVTIAGNRKHPQGEGPGNFIVLRLADQQFAVYEHLKPATMRVTVGESVHRGEMIAALGFSGDSTGPHLHFHVADSPEPLQAEGLPFVFSRFKMIGQYTNIEDLGVRKWDSMIDVRSVKIDEMPSPNAVLLFESKERK